MKEVEKQISLIVPKPEGIESAGLFQGIWFLASHLKKNGFKVKIYDEQFGEASNLLNEIINESFLVGFTVTTSQLTSAINLSKIIHKHKIPVVWGGAHPTLFPVQCIKEKYVDYLVYDEGEATLLELVKYLIENKKNLDEVDGLYYLKDAEIIKTLPREYIDINTTFVDYSLVDLNRYNRFQEVVDGKAKRFYTITTGRGCYFRCSFCINTLLNKRKWRGLTAENIIIEIKELMRRYKVEHIYFQDENFFTEKKRIEDFCRLYKKEKFSFTWTGTCRANYFNDNFINDKLLKEVKECNCDRLMMGVESGSQRVLDEIIFKDIKLKNVIYALKQLKKHNINASCSFLIGIPYETQKDRLKTLNFIKKVKQINHKTVIIGPQLYRPYPGASMYTMAKELGFRAPQNNEQWIKFLGHGGFVDMKIFPWIKNKGELESISKYYAYSEVNSKSIFKYLPTIFFGTLFKLRIRFDFYKFNADLYVYEKMIDCYHKINKSFK